MTDTPESLAARLQKEGERTVAFLQELDPKYWEAQVYSDGASWQVQEIVAHFVESENSLPLLFKNIIKDGKGVPDDFDLDRYNESKVNKIESRSREELVELFRLRRGETVAFVAGLSEADLQKTGKHPFLGHTEVVEMIRLMHLHIKLHIRDIRRIIED